MFVLFDSIYIHVNLLLSLSHVSINLRHVTRVRARTRSRHFKGMCNKQTADCLSSAGGARIEALHLETWLQLLLQRTFLCVLYSCTVCINV